MPPDERRGLRNTITRVRIEASRVLPPSRSGRSEGGPLYWGRAKRKGVELPNLWLADRGRASLDVPMGSRSSSSGSAPPPAWHTCTHTGGGTASPTSGSSPAVTPAT